MEKKTPSTPVETIVVGDVRNPEVFQRSGADNASLKNMVAELRTTGFDIRVNNYASHCKLPQIGVKCRDAVGERYLVTQGTPSA